MRKKLRTPLLKSNRRKILSSGFLILFLILPYLAITFVHSPSSQPIVVSNTYYAAAETPTLALTYYSEFNQTLSPVESNSKLYGDHVTLNATWTPADNVNGTLIQVNASAIPRTISAEGTNNTVEIDTRALGNNAYCVINVTTWLLNGTILNEVFTEVFIENFFTPHIELIAPNGGENWPGVHNITWIAWDNNTDDILTFEVLLSVDGGSSFQLLASEIKTQWLVWDFSEFLRHSDNIIEVRATDGIYTVSDRSETFFTAGGVIPTTTATDTTAPTAPTPPPVDALDMRLSIFIAAAIIASAVLSLVVYQQAKRLS
jgi:hypothetical protein